jgi:hypothetical protein
VSLATLAVRSYYFPIHRFVLQKHTVLYVVRPEYVCMYVCMSMCNVRLVDLITSCTSSGLGWCPQRSSIGPKVQYNQDLWYNYQQSHCVKVRTVNLITVTKTASAEE